MNIGNSLSTLRIQNNLERLNLTTTKQTEKLASGMRINRAADDASGLNISERMRSQIRGLETAIDNIADGISMLQTAEGGLSKIGDLLHRMNELSIKAVNAVNTEEDLEKISIEYDECKNEIDRIANTTTFNGKQLLDVNVGITKTKATLRVAGMGSFPAISHEKIDFSTIGHGNEFFIKRGNKEYRFQFTYKDNVDTNGAVRVSLNREDTSEEKANKLKKAIRDNVSDIEVEAIGDLPDDENSYTITIVAGTPVDGEMIDLGVVTNAPTLKVGNSEDDIIFLSLQAVTSSDLGVCDTSISTTKDAQVATEKISEAISKISETRGNIGATQNRLEYTIKRITIESQNVQASESRIRDVDMAKEMVSTAKTRILQQSTIGMLAQANQSGNMVLKLLKN